MRKIIMCLILAVFMFAAGGDILALTPEEIMDRRDENEFLGSAYMEAEMIIEGRRTTEKRMYSYSQGPDAFIEFLNPRDRGTKYLKLGDDLWMFFPEAEERVHISGHMLREGMMGSDFSYQDMLESEKLTELYDFEITGEEQLDSRPVYVLRGKVKDDAEASYYERKIWVDSERFIGLREELYARGGRLLKIMEVKEVKEFADGRWYPVRLVMEDQLVEDSRTILIINELEFDVDIPEGLLSLEALE